MQNLCNNGVVGRGVSSSYFNPLPRAAKGGHPLYEGLVLFTLFQTTETKGPLWNRKGFNDIATAFNP